MIISIKNNKFLELRNIGKKQAAFAISLFNKQNCSQVQKIDEKKYRKTQKQAIKDADMLENQYLPQVKLDKTEVHISLSYSVFMFTHEYVS